MRARSFDGMTCSIAGVLGALGDRWGALIMRDILLGLRRYDDLLRSSGATKATLASRLKSLEQAGLVERRPYSRRPERFEYSPTQKGRDLKLVMHAMLQVGDLWREGPAEPPMQVIDRITGEPLRLAPVSVATDARMDAADTRFQAAPGADEGTRWRVRDQD